MTTTAVSAEVWDALGRVRDPELDEPITDLGFVHELTVAGSEVRARLRLPTYFCAPNFAYLMVADAVDAIRAVPGVETVEVRLEDHFAAEEINAGVAAGAGFAGSFPAEAAGELDELRRTFRRKAHTACLARVCRRLLAEGWQVDALAGLRLADLPESVERESLVRRREELGLPATPDAPLVVDDDGRPVVPGKVAERLRFAQAVRVSIDGNAGFCRGLLKTRYGASNNTEERG
ncbi:MAG TPA: iron-sulfur cluster assembly protein [Amycolatopsis sp.]|uniref:iron-sulfur cluster assembly protein n=1 Tax=Amycolatopsis sp. TaxID=37632 RepID=UPI002B46ADE0|nr:iron-sulfur cluster assembly protein [Amycolatopsis sp.]HKS45770.1 iron-sulfur cluster assembly protein [Amycolatopsis sp.]